MKAWVLKRVPIPDKGKTKLSIEKGARLLGIFYDGYPLIFALVEDGGIVVTRIIQTVVEDEPLAPEVAGAEYVGATIFDAGPEYGIQSLHLFDFGEQLIERVER